MGEEPLSKMKSKNRKPETVSLAREGRLLAEAQQLLDAGHISLAEKVLRPLAMPSPSARDEIHAEVGGAGVGKLKRVKRLTHKRRAGKSPQQIRQHYALLVHRGKTKQAAAYFSRHADDIMKGLLAKPVEVHENTAPLPDHKPDLAGLATHFEQLNAAYKAEMLRRYKIKQQDKELRKDGSYLAKSMRKRLRAKHKSVFTTPDPERPIKPAALRTTAPKLDGRSGIRKEVAKKSKAITSIDKRMAEERRKAKAAKKEEPAPVMRHHTEPNPWLNR